MNLNDPITVIHPRFGRIPAIVSELRADGVFVAKDMSGFFFSKNGQTHEWLCWDEDIGCFIELGHEHTDYTVQKQQEKETVTQ